MAARWRVHVPKLKLWLADIRSLSQAIPSQVAREVTNAALPK
jgi:hypothetical protein